MRNKYRSEIKLGDRYQDRHTGFTGVATVVSFFEHGCERVTLKGINKNGEIVDYAFDAPEVQLAGTGEPVKLIEKKTGGPHDRAGMRRR